MTKTPRKMAGYVRVSRVNGREGENFISPELQRDKIEKWADLKGIEIVHIEPDLDESGGSQDRPGMREAIRMIEAGEVDGIVCAYLSRFARNVSAALADIERIHDAGGTVAFVQENLDPTTPMGKAMLTVLLAFAALERDNAAQGWLDSRAAAFARGVYLQERPFGYIKNDDGRLLPHDSEAPIMRETYRRAADDSLRSAAAYFAQHTMVRNGRRVVCGSDDVASYVRPAMLARMLDNRVYLGEQHAGELSNLSNHEPLVKRDIWERAQREPTFRRSANSSYPLSGIATCHACGGSMVGYGKDTHGRTRYVCGNWARKARNICASASSIDADRLAAFLLDIIRANYAEDGSNALLVGRDDQLFDLDALQSAIIEAEAERTAYALDLNLRAALGDDAYLAGAIARSDAVTAAQTAYRNAAEATTSRVEYVPLETLETLDDDELATFLSAVFRRVVVGPAIVKGKRRLIADRVMVMFHGEVEPCAAA